MRWYLLAGVAIALAAASKYTGALLILPLGVTHFWRTRGVTHAGRLLLALGTAVILFFLLNPYILLHRAQFLSDFSFEQRHMTTGHLGVDTGRNSLTYYLADAMPRIFGWPFLLVLAAGLAYGTLRREGRLVIIALFPLTLLAVIGAWEMRADRYLMPGIPFIVLIGSYGARELSRHARALTGAMRAVGTALVLFLPAALGAMPLWSVVAYHRSLNAPDTRTEAKEWILRSLPGKATIVTGPFGIRLPEERFSMLLIPFSPTGSEAFAPFYAPEWYEDFDLLIASDYDYGRFSLEPERYKALLAQYARLREDWHLAAEFAPKEGQNGPTVWLYRPPGRPAEAFSASLFAPLSAIAETSFVVNFAEHLATSLFEKGSVVKAGQVAGFVLGLAPDHVRLANSFAWSLFKKGSYGEALALAERSLSADSTQAEMVGLRGSIELRTGNEPKAEEDLLRAIRLNDKLEVPYLDLELLYRRRNDPKRQIGILRRYEAILAPGSDNWNRTEAYLRTLGAR